MRRKAADDEFSGDYTTTEVVHSDTYPEIDPASTADLEGRSVFITGASKGLGRCIGISFARAGASNIAIAARSSLEATAQAIKEAAVQAGRKEPNVLCLSLDISVEWSVDAAVRKIQECFQTLDVVINNAAILCATGPIDETKPSEWWECSKRQLLTRKNAREEHLQY